MKLQKAIKIAFNMIRHSQLRSWLTIIGIVIGVAAIIAIIAIGNGFEEQIQEELGGLGSDIITITAGFDRANQCPGPHCAADPNKISSSEEKPLTNKEKQALRGITDILYINTVVSGQKDVYYLGETASLTIEGMDQNVMRNMGTLEVQEGRLLAPGDANVALIGASIAEEVYKTKVPLNRPLTIENKTLRVVGILKKGGAFGTNDKKIVIPVTIAQDILEKERTVYDSLIIKIKDQDQAEEVEKKIENKLLTTRNVNKDNKDFTILSMKSIQETISTVLTGFTLFLGVIAAVSLLVGAVGIANTMFTAVLEKTREIGIMKALGAKNSDILQIFVLNAGMVGFVGGFIGAIFGTLISLGIPKLGYSFSGDGTPLRTALTPELILFALAFATIIGIISGLVPAYRASKLKPVDALRAP